MIRTLLATIAITVASATTPSFANPLSGPEIQKALSGNKVYLATRWGIEFPMIYSANGQVTGDGTGTGLGRFFVPKETGDWWVAGNKMCQKFPTWYRGKTFCFKLEQNGPDRLIWKRDDGAQGTARIG